MQQMGGAGGGMPGMGGGPGAGMDMEALVSSQWRVDRFFGDIVWADNMHVPSKDETNG